MVLPPLVHERLGLSRGRGLVPPELVAHVPVADSLHGRRQLLVQAHYRPEQGATALRRHFQMNANKDIAALVVLLGGPDQAAALAPMLPILLSVDTWDRVLSPAERQRLLVRFFTPPLLLYVPS